jgi:hypothetical protein
MSDDADFNSVDVASELPAQPHGLSHVATIALDEQRRGWSSALFPAKPKQSDSMVTAAPSDNSSSNNQHSAVHIDQRPSTSNPLMSGLFVPRSFAGDD